MSAPAEPPTPPIRPAAFSAAGAPAAPARGTSALTERRPYLLAFAVALLLAAVFGALLMLPRWAPPQPVPAAPAAPAATAAPAVPPLPTAAADDDADLAVARKTAQELLRAALTKQAQLVAARAESWARSEVHAVATTIASGEKASRENRYRAAQNFYRDALAALADLDARLPAIITALLARGEQALAAGDSAAAEAAFAQVLAIWPDHAGASAGRQRAVSLDHVLALIGQAEGYEHLGAIDKARAAFREALALDATTASATAGLARIEQGERAVQFQRAMAQGMTALARGEPAAAHQAFTRAGTLQPASTEAAAALQQTARAAAAQAIEQAIEQARRAESDEAWREAVRHYDAALALDRDLVSVDDARRAAQARATLDARIEAYRADLLTLTADSARADATEVLAAARAVAHPGRRLTQQITALDNAVRRARTPVSVALHSNGTTAISIEQIGAFAPFTERTIELLPGRYRASGQRDGYRDVRVEFSVVPAAAAPIVTLQCEDELATGH